jgi:hypothetical protein
MKKCGYINYEYNKFDFNLKNDKMLSKFSQNMGVIYTIESERTTKKQEKVSWKLKQFS